MDNIHKLKMQLANEGWEVNEKITSHATHGYSGSIGCSISVKRWDWHGRGIDVQFNRHVSDAENETEIEKALQELLSITREAWVKFPDSVPEECGKGTLVKKNLILPFSELRLLKGKQCIPQIIPIFEKGDDTGHFDAEGNLIQIGDIVYEDCNGLTAEVVWNPERASFWLKDLGEGYGIEDSDVEWNIVRKYNEIDKEEQIVFQDTERE